VVAKQFINTVLRNPHLGNPFFLFKHKIYYIFNGRSSFLSGK